MFRMVNKKAALQADGCAKTVLPKLIQRLRPKEIALIDHRDLTDRC